MRMSALVFELIIMALAFPLGPIQKIRRPIVVTFGIETEFYAELRLVVHWFTSTSRVLSRAVADSFLDEGFVLVSGLSFLSRMED
jgi:hypothetical protein